MFLKLCNQNTEFTKCYMVDWCPSRNLTSAMDQLMHWNIIVNNIVVIWFTSLFSTNENLFWSPAPKLGKMQFLLSSWEELDVD